MKKLKSRPVLLGIVTTIILFCYSLRLENPWYFVPLAFSDAVGVPERITVLVFYVLFSFLVGYIVYRLLNKPLSAKLLYSVTIMYILASKIVICILLMNDNDFSVKELFIVYIPGLIVVITGIVVLVKLWTHDVLRKITIVCGIIMILLMSYTLVMQILFSLQDYPFLEKWKNVYIIDSSVKMHLKYISSLFAVCMLLWLIIREMSMIKK